jgi:hypothetical protein
MIVFDLNIPVEAASSDSVRGNMVRLIEAHFRAGVAVGGTYSRAAVPT